MARQTDTQDFTPITDAAQLWIKRAMVEDRSVLSDSPLWTIANLLEIRRAFVDRPDTGEGNFLTKLKEQLSDSTPEAQKLMAEMLWIVLLFPSNVGPGKKRELITEIWALSGEALPRQHIMLTDQLLSGIGSGGMGINNYRWKELAYLVSFADKIKGFPPSERQAFFDAYERFVLTSESIPDGDRRQFPQMLRYMVFPDRVERASSNGGRRKILAAFGEFGETALENMGSIELDQAMLALRCKLEKENPGLVLDFYRSPLRERWMTKTTNEEVELPASLGMVAEDPAMARLWLFATGENGEAWQMFQSQNCVAMDWPGLPDLRAYQTRDSMTEALKSVAPPGKVADPTNDSLACWQFLHAMRIGDTVLAKEGRSHIRGVGVVEGDYRFQGDAPAYQHRRDIRWIKTGDWVITGQILAMKTLTAVTGSTLRANLESCVSGFGEPVPPTNPSPRFWWANFSPERFDVELKPDGHVEPWTTRNDNDRPRNLPESFAAAQPGDMMIGYSCAPRMRASVLCRVTRAIFESEEGPAIEFERVRALNQPVSRKEMLADKRLAKLRPLKQPQGSLYPLSRLEYEAILDLAEDGAPAIASYTKHDALQELFMSPERLAEAMQQLRRKLNLVLQGPPGVGKSFAARRLAYLLLAVKDDSRVEMVQFHPSTSYEDFVIGLRPDGKGHFALKPGIFHRFCRKAQGDPKRSYVFIIDEINRGNLPKILGELMMLIEHDKRGKDFAVPLSYGNDDDENFFLPDNLHVIGTMNTADRSLAIVDYALRRRFAFITLDPNFGEEFQKSLRDRGCASTLVEKICSRIAALNAEICKDTRSLGRGYQIGHSYFCGDGPMDHDENWYRDVVTFEIKPLLAEYWMDDQKKVDDEVKKLLL